MKNFSFYRERRNEFDKKAFCVDFYNSLIRAAFKKNNVYKYVYVSKLMYKCNKEIGKALFKCLDIYGAFQEKYKDP